MANMQASEQIKNHIHTIETLYAKVETLRAKRALAKAALLQAHPEPGVVVVPAQNAAVRISKIPQVHELILDIKNTPWQPFGIKKMIRAAKHEASATSRATATTQSA